jgi:hypothetical protein
MILLVVQMVFAVGSAAAFLGVIWPAIRQQQRLGQKMEELLDDKALRETIAFYASFAQPVDKKKGD